MVVSLLTKALVSVPSTFAIFLALLARPTKVIPQIARRAAQFFVLLMVWLVTLVRPRLAKTVASARVSAQGHHSAACVSDTE